MTDFKSLNVPRMIEPNMEFRKAVFKQAASSVDFREACWVACRESCSFWVNTFVWTYDPRKVGCPIMPFLTWPFQDEGFDSLHGAIMNQHDVLIEKSRDMGASWICLLKFLHCWLFYPGTTFLMMSRVSDLVDCAGNPDALFWKIDHTLKYMPKWLLPDEKAVKRTYMHLENLEIGTTIDGYTTTGDSVVGGRRTAALFDEFPKVKDSQDIWAQSADMSNCRIFNGTPNGTNNTFYRLTQMETIKKLRFHWTAHPLKAHGLYYVDGKPTSPWYENEFKRRGCNRREMAAQVDIDYLGSSFQFFESDEIENLVALYGRAPSRIGELVDGKFADIESGKLSYWGHMIDGMCEPGEFVIGVDVAQGAGGPMATPSCVSVFNRKTGMKQAEYASASIKPEELGDYVAKLGRWFNNASVIWEDQGPGVPFGKRLIAINYPNIYYRRVENKIDKTRTTTPGIYMTSEVKLSILTEYRRALSSGDYVNPSVIALRECHKIIFDVNGVVVNSLSLSKDDPSGAKANHADRVIADALGWKFAAEYSIQEKKDEEAQGPAVNSIAWRRKEREKAERAKKFWQTRRVYA